MLQSDMHMTQAASTSIDNGSRRARGLFRLLIAAAAIGPMLVGCGDAADGEKAGMEGSYGGSSPASPGAPSDEASDELPGEMPADFAALTGGTLAIPGRIQAEDYKAGGEGVGYHDSTPGNQGGAYRTDNVDIQPKATGDGYNVGWITAGEWLAYDVSVAASGAYTFKARVASGAAGNKTLHIEVDGQNVASATFTSAAGWQSWTEVVVGDVQLSAGAHTLKIVADTAGFNLNYVDAALPENAMWIGAAVNKPDNNIGSFLSASSSVGPFRVRRSFTPGLPEHIDDTDAADDVANNVITFHSIKPPSISGVSAGTYDAKLKSLAKSFPTDHTTYLTMYHEPENDDMTGAQFVTMFRHFYTVVKAANPNIKVGTVHMSYHWRPGAAATSNPADWWVGSAYTDFIGVDDYNDATTSKRTNAGDDPAFQRWYTWAASKGKPLAVVEFGRLENPNDAGARAEDLLDSEEWLRDHGFFMFLYWQAIGDKNVDWRVDTSASKAALRDIASRGLTGW